MHAIASPRFFPRRRSSADEIAHRRPGAADDDRFRDSGHGESEDLFQFSLPCSRPSSVLWPWSFVRPWSLVPGPSVIRTQDEGPRHGPRTKNEGPGTSQGLSRTTPIRKTRLARAEGKVRGGKPPSAMHDLDVGDRAGPPLGGPAHRSIPLERQLAADLDQAAWQNRIDAEGRVRKGS